MSDSSSAPAASPIAEPSLDAAAPSAASNSTVTPAPDAPRRTDAATSPTVAPIAELLAPDQSQESDPVSRLTAAQQLALHHLAAGASIRDAANKAGVGRRTLHRWMRDEPDFAAAYNAWRRELIDSARARALAMTDDALATIRHAILGGDAYAALQLVRGMGVLREQKPGSDDPKLVRRRRVVATARRESRLYKAEQSYEVTSSKPFETPEQIDESIASLQRMKEHMIWLKEMHWHVYENTRDLSEDECIRRRIYDRERPADYPGEGWKSALPGRPGSKFPAPAAMPPPAPADQGGGAAEPSPSIDRAVSQRDPSAFDDEDDVDY